MPRKKKPVVAVVEELALPFMTKEELYGARMYIAEADLAQLQLSVTLAQRREYLRQIDPEGKLEAFDAKVKGMAAEASAKRTGYNALMKQVEERLGLLMAKYAWDDETGLLRYLPESVEEPST